MKNAVRDFRSELAGVRCWDRGAHETFERTGYPDAACVLQNREELVAFCEWIEARRIRSFLEIGIWTGRLLTVLEGLFHFDLVAACDNRFAASIGFDIALPDGAVTFFGDSHSDAYVRWRESLGHVDLVLIDGDHSYAGVRRDFEINRLFPHRYLVFHDIAGDHPATEGVRRLWRDLEGEKVEIVLPHRELGLEVPTMGIGIWRDPSAAQARAIRARS